MTPTASSRKPQKKKFMYASANETEKCLEWKKNGKVMSARGTKNVNCDLRNCDIRRSREIHDGEQFYVATNPSRIAHKQCVERRVAMYESAVDKKKFMENEYNMTVPMSTTEPETQYFAPDIEPDEVAASVHAPEPRRAASVPTAQTLDLQFEMRLELEKLRGYKEAMEVVFRSGRVRD